jgi:hypothetical protein
MDSSIRAILPEDFDRCDVARRARRRATYMLQETTTTCHPMTALVVAITGAIRRAELAGCQHARERVGQPSLRIDVVQLSRLNERVHESSPIGVALRSSALKRGVLFGRKAQCKLSTCLKV